MLIKLFIEEQRSIVSEFDDMSRFHIEVHGAATEADLQVALGRLGRVDGTEYAWISVDELRCASGRSNDADWQADFSRMVDFAESRGWTDGDRKSLRVHIVSGNSLKHK